MAGYDSTWMLVNAVTLTALLAMVTVLAWQRRGPLSGLRWTGVALLPLALYLTGLLRVFWAIVEEFSRFFAGLVWRPSVWLGLAVTVVAVALIVVPGRIGRRIGADEPTRKAARAPRAAGPDDDLDEIEAILKRRGIN